jgi:putative ABC transport system permease protein
VREIRIPGIRRILRISWTDEAMRRDVRDEIHFHIEARVEELVGLGMSPRAARERAESEFGDIRGSERELLAIDRRRRGNEQREELLMSFIEDVRYAARSLIKRPALLIVTTIALSIGIAANAIMFGVVDQLLLRPPPHVMAAQDLHRIYFRHTYSGEEYIGPVTTYRAYLALRDRVPAFSQVAAQARAGSYTLGSGRGARRVRVQPVSGNFFSTVGARAVTGRLLLQDDDRPPQGSMVAVVSEAFWKQQLGQVQDIVGRSIVLDAKPFVIVGVAPPGFSGIDRSKVDIWIPLSANALQKEGPTWHSEPNNWWLQIFARQRSGVAPSVIAEQATAAYRVEHATWQNRPQEALPDVLLGSVIGTRAPSGWTPESKVSLWLLGVSAIVLLIACANVANLLIARTMQRRREISVRMALGISRSRLVRMLLTEAGLLAVLGAVVALAVALAGSRVVQRVLLPEVVWSDTVLDSRVLGFTLLATILCIVFAGLAPALQGLGLRVSDNLKAGAQQIAGTRGTLRFALLIFQAALSIVLLIGAGLFVRSLRGVTSKDVGIDLDRVLLVTMDLEDFGFNKATMENLYREGRERLQPIPGVQGVSIVRGVVPSRSASGISFEVPGRARVRFEHGGPYYGVTDTEFFGTMGTALLRGRNFVDAEMRTPNRSIIINRTLASGYWPNADPLGQCVKIGSDTTCSTIVGVVEDVMTFQLVKDDRATVYVPPGHASFGNKPPTSFIIRAAGAPQNLVPLVQAQLQTLAPNMPFVRAEPFTDIVAPQLRPWRLGATMFTLFGGIALVIAAVGLYSVMAYWVSQRTQEIGVRMALGAKQTDIVRLVARQTFLAVGLGLVFGGLVAAFASRWIADLLYETSPRDPMVYASAALVLAVAALLASVIPAVRSASVDPALALRTD